MTLLLQHKHMLLPLVGHRAMKMMLSKWVNQWYLISQQNTPEFVAETFVCNPHLICIVIWSYNIGGHSLSKRANRPRQEKKFFFFFLSNSKKKFFLVWIPTPPLRQRVTAYVIRSNNDAYQTWVTNECFCSKFQWILQRIKKSKIDMFICRRCALLLS